jgi:hypothetical protein
MPDYVRVREGRWEYSIPARRVTDGVEVLDKDPYERSGKPRKPMPVTDLGTPAPGSKKERQRAKKTPEANALGEDAGQSSATPEEEN